MKENQDLDINGQDLITNQDLNPLSITEFKAFPGCSDYSDENARKISATLLRIANLLFEKPISNLNQIDTNQLKQAA